ncbi:MAG: DoxX family membrane protein, partial [Chloroflexi bacterium]|nr:DoxX family membrane protein [Chloroflexota bacterium]
MTLAFVLQVTLGGLFIVSAVPKLLSPRLFIESVRKYGLLPGRLNDVYGWALPSVQFIVGAALTFGILPRFAALSSLALLASFVIAMTTAVRRGQNLDCGCFGLLYREKVGPPTIARDLVLAALLG